MVIFAEGEAVGGVVVLGFGPGDEVGGVDDDEVVYLDADPAGGAGAVILLEDNFTEGGVAGGVVVGLVGFGGLFRIQELKDVVFEGVPVFREVAGDERLPDELALNGVAEGVVVGLIQPSATSLLAEAFDAGGFPRIALGINR